MNLGTTGISPLMFVAEASFSERERGIKKEGEREGLPGQMHCFYRCKTAKKKKTQKQAILSCCKVVAGQHKGIIISNMGTKQTCVPSLIAQHLIVWEEKAAEETNQQGFRVFGLLVFLSRAVFQTPFFYPFINTTTNL